MSALPITITISVNENTPPHQLRAIQELLGFAVNPVAAHGNGIAAAPDISPRTAASQALQAAGIPNATVISPAAASAAAMPAIGPVIPAQIPAVDPAAAAAPPAAAPAPGKRQGRPAYSPEEKANRAAAKAAGMDYTQWVIQQANLQPRSILRDQPGPGEAIPATAAEAPVAGAAPATAVPATAANRDAIGATDPLLMEVQEVYNHLNTVKAGLPFGILRGMLPGSTIFKPEQLPAEHRQAFLTKLYAALPPDQRPAA